MSVAERVYVVDDDPAVRKSLSRLLRSSGFDALTFGSPEEFLRHVPPDASGCLILDVRMPGLDGFALQRELSSQARGLPVVFLTGHGDVPHSVEAMKKGALDFLTKPVEDGALLAAVRGALEADRRDRRSRAEAAEVRRRFEKLTPREREVLQRVVAGKLNKQIGGDLGISEKTVKVHRGRVMEKMGALSLAALVRLADRAGLARD